MRAPQKQATAPPSPAPAGAAGVVPLGPPASPLKPKRASSVVVLDYGSQYTQLICRRVRELGVYSVLLPGDASLGRIQAESPTVVILSGGPNSVHVEGAPTVPTGFWDYATAAKIPVLGICYGMQLIVQTLGGEVKPAAKSEYGRMPITTSKGSSLYADVRPGHQMVWMSHGDEAVKLPEGFRSVATSEQGSIVAIENTARAIYGLQYHPEVTHTERGLATLKHFLFKVRGGGGGGGGTTG